MNRIAGNGKSTLGETSVTLFPFGFETPQFYVPLIPRRIRAYSHRYQQKTEGTCVSEYKNDDELQCVDLKQLAYQTCRLLLLQPAVAVYLPEAALLALDMHLTVAPPTVTVAVLL